ncbi:bifunctional anthranilate synthase component II/anthranilate phosphoribosyltransferase [Marispirochaeta sp.]|jgi:anthranilate synthase/phosphoribosyltransferase|uniref:bifunctional anthranilate synthase component II/anthranilate phosphoribosyltransferase n=1 Tax=Marispirochaeta sp. TaxID=2038653 RepID=UPI0029C784A4|nr:bifunctional anthranilate synthase component II/anthranilate phosphoribosyltransferase [Marispirochaeta sp.]
MYVLIDNYDSFTYNIYQYLKELTNIPVEVFRNDKISLEELQQLPLKGLIVSPGPGRPSEAGISVEAIRRFAGKIPILGICLGHQAIGEAFGGKTVQARRIVHGKTEAIDNDGKGVFRNLPSRPVFTRYHSLAVEEASLPAVLEVSARSDDGEIMGLRHREFDVEGVQFHPESIAAEDGKKLLANFIEYRREPYPLQLNLQRVISGEDLSREDAAGFMREVTEGSVLPARLAAYLTAFNAKGITPEEIAGCAQVLQEKRVSVKAEKPVLDTCGTGGDGKGTFNISSMAALIASACGAEVAKHGNRAISSLCGSADFYRALGINIDLGPEAASRMIRDEGFAFLFAPRYHGAMRHAAQVRRELGFKTIMNMLGPLSNPAGAEYQLIGIFDPNKCELMARAAMLLGIKRGMVVHGSDGLDELTVTGPSKIVRFTQGEELVVEEFFPQDLGIALYSLEDLRGGEAEDNAAMARELLNGGGRPALKDAACLNAGAALVVYGLADSIKEGYGLALRALNSGQVREKLGAVIEASKR